MLRQSILAIVALRYHLAIILILLLLPTFSYAQSSLFSTLSDNTALDLGKFTNDPHNGNCAVPISITDYSRFTYDPVDHQLLLHGGGHAATGRDDVLMFDFDTLTWSSSYAPTPIAEMTSSNLDGVTGSWRSTGYPVATHTADLMPFAANTGELVRMRGYGPSACSGVDYGEGRIAHYNPHTKIWSYSPVSTGDYDSIGQIPGSEYDPISGKIIVVGRSGMWIYDPVTKALSQPLSYSKGTMGYLGNLVYFPLNQKMYYFSRGTPVGVWEVTLDRSNWSNSTVTQVTGMSGTPGTSGVAPGWACDTNNNIIGGNVSNGIFKAFDPLTKVWTTQTIQIQGESGSIGNQAAMTIDYNPVDNVFLFLTDYNSGSRLWAYKYKMSSPSELLSEAADFDQRCQAPGVLKCIGFDSPSELEPAVWPSPGLYPAGGDVYRGTFDTTVKASGNGSLKFTIPGYTGADAAGSWKQDFGHNFLEGETFYIQFRQRFSSEMMSVDFPGTTGWKQVIFHNRRASCAGVELTTRNYFEVDFPIMYTDCGGRSLYDYQSDGTILLEQGDTPTTGYNCQYGQHPNGCAVYQANQWLTYYYEVRIGTWDQPDSSIKAWVSHEGQPLKQFVNISNFTLRQDNPGEGYDYLTLTPYMTAKDSSVDHPTAYTWYDELIISTQPILPSNDGTGGTPPISPSSLQIQ